MPRRLPSPATPTVRLRPWCHDDAEAIAGMTADTHVRRWSSMGDDVAGWIARQRAGARGPSWAICRPDDERPLGKVALRLPGRASPATSCAAIRPSDAPVGELSYWLLPATRGRGVAHAAVQAALRWVAASTDIRSVVLDVEVDNVASQRLALRLGADHRAPARVERDRCGVPRALAVFVLTIVREPVRAGRLGP